MIFGRTDLRISLSRPKFDAEADFEVRSAVAPQKPGLLCEKQNFRSKKLADFVLGSKLFVPKSTQTAPPSTLPGTSEIFSLVKRLDMVYFKSHSMDFSIP